MTPLEPIRQSFQIDSKRWETPNRFRIAVNGNRDENLCCPNIDPCGVWFDDGKAGNSATLFGHEDSFSVPPLAWTVQEGSLPNEIGSPSVRGCSVITVLSTGSRTTLPDELEKASVSHRS